MLPAETTALLHDIREGDARAIDALFPVVYDELRRLSEKHIRNRSDAVTLSSTGLVHEAYLKMVGGGDWADRAHFMAVAARAMRQILTDRARARRADKRGGVLRAVTLHDDLVAGHDAPADQLLAVNAALERLEARDERLARLVELRFYGGMEVDEAAEVLGTSPRTTARDWARAKAYLRSFLA